MAKASGIHNAAVTLGKEGGKATKKAKKGIFSPKYKAAAKRKTSKSGPVKVRKYKAKPAAKKKSAAKKAAPRKKATPKKVARKKAAAPRKKAVAKKKAAPRKKTVAKKLKQLKLF